MTAEELRREGPPEGYHIKKVIDRFDEKGPLLRSYSPNRSQEEENAQNAKFQRVLDEIFTAQCLRGVWDDV